MFYMLCSIMWFAVTRPLWCSRREQHGSWPTGRQARRVKKKAIWKQGAFEDLGGMRKRIVYWSEIECG